MGILGEVCTLDGGDMLLKSSHHGVIKTRSFCLTLRKSSSLIETAGWRKPEVRRGLHRAALGGGSLPI